MLYGRDDERARIGAFLDGARSSRSGVLVLRGEPGVGKTALLEEARELAADMHLLTARGVESESELPFAALHQLVRPALGDLDALPPPRHRALRGALGLGERTGDDRFLVSVAVLQLIAEFAERRPVLALVDDAHWLDASSAATLLVVARRLDAEPVALLFATRDDGLRRFDAPDLPVLELGGLGADAAETLLAHHATVEVEPGVRDQLVGHTGGNALALLELPAAPSAAQLSGAEPLPAELPLTRLYQDAASNDRRAAHRALADALGPDEADRRAWHRVAAALGSDEVVLRELEQAGARASLRGGHADAARAYERVAELTTDRPTRGRRLVAAAVEASMAGRNHDAVALAERAAAISDDPLGRAECVRVRGIAELQRGRPSEGLRIFLSGVRELPDGETQKALELLAHAAESASLAGEPDGMREVSRAAARLSIDEDERAAFLLSFLSGLGPFSEGDAAGAPLLQKAVALGELADDAQRVFWASAAAAFMGDLERGSVLAARAATLARQRGQVALVASALASCAAYLLVENRFAEASADAEEAVRLGREIGADNLTGLPLGVLAMVAALRGRGDKARVLAGEVAGFAHERGLALPSTFAVWALANLDLAPGSWPQALERYDALSEVRPGFGHPLAAILTIPDRMETLVRLGRTEEAVAALPGFEAWATHVGPTWARSRLASCRALVTTGDEATRHFEEAVQEAEATRPSVSPASASSTASISVASGAGSRRGHSSARPSRRSSASAPRSGPNARAPSSARPARRPARLFLSPRTIDAHPRSVFAKLEITSRTQLARLPLGEGRSPTPSPDAAVPA